MSKKCKRSVNDCKKSRFCMLFTANMSRRKIYTYGALVILVFVVWFFLGPGKKNEGFPERVKISLRDVGNQLLLSNQDSTSLVLPVVELERSKYKLSFQNQLSFEPSGLVSIVQRSFQKSALPLHYRVEVLQCSNQEVAYSYEIKGKEENSIVPCRGRILPEDCYTIEVAFIDMPDSFLNRQMFLYFIIFIVFIFQLDFLFSKRKKATVSGNVNEKYSTVGSFHFYPEQNKLVKQAIEISLSKKECELLSIFVATPNQIIKRDELTKKVWEDNGVIVGRSLDTYISKLRMKLKDDDSVKLTNVHGVGYKLEINN